MSKVTVTLNGREFTIGCEDGQEAYLKSLAAYLDDKVSGISGQVGQIGDLRLLLMASLVVVDELKEAERRSESLDAHLAKMREEARGGDLARSGERVQLASAIADAAERLEQLAASLELEEVVDDAENGSKPDEFAQVHACRRLVSGFSPCQVYGKSDYQTYCSLSVFKK